MTKEELKAYDDSYKWWEEFTEARKEALCAMKRLGMSYSQMHDALNFNWTGQAQAILFDAKSKYEE